MLAFVDIANRYTVVIKQRYKNLKKSISVRKILNIYRFFAYQIIQK